MNTMRHAPLELRLWTRIDTRRNETGCWLWTGRKSQGWGQIMDCYQQHPAYRMVYEALVGPIPPGLELDHLCRNRACVNPAHLEPVTTRENVLRSEGITARLARRTHCANGHPFSPENTRMRGTTRVCRVCLRDYKRRGPQGTRAEAGARLMAALQRTAEPAA